MIPKIQFGKCPFCEKEILTVDAKNNPTRLKGYSEFWIAISDGSKMKVAICDACKAELTEEKASAVLEAHKEYWQAGMEEAYNQKIEEIKTTKEQNINHFNSLELIKYGLKERDLE